MKFFKSLSPVILVAGFLSCSGNNSCKNVVLTDAGDSLSYAAGKHLSRGVRSMAYGDMGIDSASLGDFVAGLRAAYPAKVTSKSKAYAYGMSLGASAMDMFEKTRSQFKSQGYGDIDSRLFLEGVISALYEEEGAMDVNSATALYNGKRYREESETFMQRNAERKGVVTLPSGLQYKLDKEGYGAIASKADTVACIYKGLFPEGGIFETSAGKAVEVPVAGVIPGLQEAFMFLPAGTLCTLYVPWHLGYGAYGAEGIPPYKTLIFELEIVEVIKKKK